MAALEELEKKFPDVRWTGRKDLLVRQVASKEPSEVDAVRRAQQVSEKVLDALLSKLRPGLSEKEVAAQIVYDHLRLGAESMSFDPVVASGPNSALPHARPTHRILKHGDPVLLDFGCFLDGYSSDMTRTVFLGEPAEEERRVYDLVVNAQERAIEIARAGISAKALDAAARDLIRDAGYAENFNHSLGHGVGLQIHEWPRVSYAVDYDLPAGCIVTIEPGVYLPGRFGVRVEDMILLTDSGCENLTRSSKGLIVL
jgi:Xaa-Pro aminopeptidase